MPMNATRTVRTVFRKSESDFVQRSRTIRTDACYLRTRVRNGKQIKKVWMGCVRSVRERRGNHGV
jgi:hypothetical protein